MNPISTLRARRLIAALFLGWALLAIVLSLGALRAPGDRLYHPFVHTRLNGVSRVTELAPGAQGAGVRPGDLVVAMNGRPFEQVLRRGTSDLDSARANTYQLQRPDGSFYRVSLAPEPVGWTQEPAVVALHALMLLVAVLYLVTGSAAWWMKPDRSEAWTLLLFCSTLAAQLSTMAHYNLITWGWPRMLINAPLIGAVTFHLFTTYPIEPGWVVRHRRIQLVPYALAAGLAAFSFFERQLGAPAGTGMRLSIAFTQLLFVVSLTVVGIERHRHRDGPLRDRADLVFWAAVVSFAPLLLLYLAQPMLETALPYSFALVWSSLFPVAVGFGIVRGQLFEMRSVARSSAAYGAATLKLQRVEVRRRGELVVAVEAVRCFEIP